MKIAKMVYNIFHWVAKRNFPIMLVGESGAGKSTIAHIIGDFDAPKGSVTIDGLDLCDIDIEWWRQQITYVSQHPHIMKGTLREGSILWHGCG